MKCSRCRKNYVLTTQRREILVCYECQKPYLDQPIEDPRMKKLFDIPEELYKENNFLRHIKANYQRFKTLSEKQRQAFEQTVQELLSESS